MTTNNCFNCKWKRNIPGDAHVTCSRPIPDMKVSEHGARKGWAHYPINFDPIWLEPPGGKCRGYVSKDAKGLGVSLREIVSTFGPYENAQAGIDDLDNYLHSLGMAYKDRVTILKKVYHITSSTMEAVASVYDKVEDNASKG